MEKRILAWLTETHVHAGTGQTTGAVDLPIQREGHTGYPTIVASGLKGALREQAPPEQAKVWFGPETKEIAGGSNSAYAGCIALSDARLLAFPVRSLFEVFIWVTSPYVLSRLARDLVRAGALEEQAAPLRNLSCGSARFRSSDGSVPQTLAVEELNLTRADGDDLSGAMQLLNNLLPQGDIYTLLREKFGKHLLLVSDADYAYLVRNACPIQARNVLEKDTKKSKNLWYEESLPPDSLLYSLALIEDSRKPKPKNSGGSESQSGSQKPAAEVAGEFQKWIEGRPYFQLGGNETVGEGWCHVQLVATGTVKQEGQQ